MNDVMTATTTSRSGYDLTRLTDAQIVALAADLTPDEKRVILHQGTERPFCGLFLDNKKKGVYTCRLCGLPLFASNAKFESGTGWPSFFQPFDADHVRTIEDHSHGMTRVEIRCARCDGHLGHVFDDGPPPTHLRYCLNSASMSFVDDGQPMVLRQPG
jgi:peptide-methionine (R)-S-oxide reductase